MNQRVLNTKFHIPSWNKNGISRLRLLERLKGSEIEQKKITLVSAPAGYGKTTLLAEWLNISPNKSQYVWLSLDESHNDPAVFLLYFLSAFQGIDDSLCQSALSLLGIPQILSVTAIIDELINNLSNQDSRVIYILDDYHAINNPEIHKALEYFIENIPPHFHLIITTREDPPFALARWRARGQMTEIRASDLRFTPEEAKHFFNDLMRLELENESLIALDLKIEGWVAGMQLAALALENNINKKQFLNNFSGSHRYIIDYLIDEVLKNQTPEIRDFLCKTAILNRFNVSLCQELTNNSASQSILTYLERSNLFIIPLDEQRGWYRYHHLFADVLRAGLTKDIELEVYKLAAIWFEKNGFFSEAIHYWLETPEKNQAAKSIELLAGELLNNGEIQTLLKWLDALPEHIVNKNPNLILYKAISLLFTGQIERAKIFIADAQKIFADTGETKGLGRLHSIQAWFSLLSANHNRGELAIKALEQLEETDEFFRAITMLVLIDYYQWNADHKSATKIFQDCYQIGKRINNCFITLGALAYYTFGLLESGRLREAELLCSVALEEYVDSRGNQLPILGIIYSPLASIYYEKGEFDKAQDFAVRGIDLCKNLFSNLTMGGDSEIVLARVAFQQGDPNKAFEILQSAINDAQKRSVLTMVMKLNLVRIDLLLLQGNAAAANFAIKEIESQIPLHLVKTDQILNQYYARYWLISGKTEKALEILREFEQTLQNKGNIRRLIGNYVTQSLAYQMLGNLNIAKTTFEAAINLAENEGYLTVFTSKDGWQTQPLLQANRNTYPDFIKRILKMCRISSVIVPPDHTPIDSLSEQEMRVMQLIISGKTNKEIASELVITVGTAKWHVHNVLQKLGVNNRPQAIARAKELEITSM